KKFVDNTAYKFVGWDFDFDTEIYQNYTINSVFEEVQRWYTVIFVNYDYSFIEEQEVEYRKPAFAPASRPERPATESTVYEFCGWDKDFSCVEENLTVVAQ